MIDNPCYNRKTSQECENRQEGCSLICALWHDYVKRRNREYEARKKASKETRDLIEHYERLARKVKKR